MALLVSSLLGPLWRSMPGNSSRTTTQAAAAWLLPARPFVLLHTLLQTQITRAAAAVAHSTTRASAASHVKHGAVLCSRPSWISP